MFQIRSRRVLAVAGAAGAVSLSFVAFAPSAQALPPSAVWIDTGVLRVVSPAGLVNAITLSQPAAGTLRVVDAVSTVAAVFPCVAVSAHQVDCPAAAANSFAIDTGDLGDRITNTAVRPGRIVAGDGNDSVSDGPGNQVISLGNGNDTIVQGLGADRVDGGPGVDTVSYAARVANVAVRFDGLANDGQAGEGDQLLGLEGGLGGSANDLMIGDAAANKFDGRGGVDNIQGGAGNDSLVGGPGNDTVNGGIGNDLIDGGLGNDQLFGGAGVDTVTYSSRASAVVVRLDNVANDGQAGEADNAHNDIENILGGSANDLLIGSNLNNSIQGGNGNDNLQGGNGNDTLVGGAGTDVANGGANVDACNAETEFNCEI